MATTLIPDLDSLLAAGGQDLGCTAWVELTASVIADFAAATGSPGAGDDRVAPPMLLLSLTNRFLPELLEVGGSASGLNYGAGPIRFNTAVGAGERIRASATLLQASEVPGGVQTAIEIRIEVQGSEEPACTVESLSRWLR